MKMTGNTILITGGTSGIGLGLALRLHEAGNKVIVAGRRKELLDQITVEHPGIEALVLDIADPVSIARAAETVASAHPELNVVINNAGIMLRENLLDPASLQVAEDHVTINLLGTIRMTYAFLPLLVDNDDAVVLNVSSALAFAAFEGDGGGAGLQPAAAQQRDPTCPWCGTPNSRWSSSGARAGPPPTTPPRRTACSRTRSPSWSRALTRGRRSPGSPSSIPPPPGSSSSRSWTPWGRCTASPSGDERQPPCVRAAFG